MQVCCEAIVWSKISHFKICNLALLCDLYDKLEVVA